jgi:2-polyprenyl-6-methoxyphenol hydroxylase-like FAD-dependent oxidoreductase
MFGENTPEVLIAGAGPVGMCAALALVRRGIRVRIVDRGLWPCAQSYALALHPQSLELLQEFGLHDAILDGAQLVRNLGLYDNEKLRAEIQFGPDAGPLAAVAVIRQDALEKVLEDALKANGVRVEWRHEVSRLEPRSDHVEVTIDKFEKESRGYVVAHTEWTLARSTDFEVPFVIGADGYNSRVRRALKLDFHEAGPAQYFAVFEFQSDANRPRDMRIVFGEKTVDVLWPLPGGACRWSFQLPGYHDQAMEDLKEGLLAAGLDFPTERSKDRLYIAQDGESPILDESNLRTMIEQRAPWFQGGIGPIVWKSIVRFERRLASGFGEGRVWLAGDAAHLTGPVGVQSMNLGLVEARELAGALSGILRNGQSTETLNAYNQRWLGVWRQLHNIDGGLLASALTDDWIRSRAADLTSCLPAYGEGLAALAGQIGLTLAHAAGA